MPELEDERYVRELFETLYEVKLRKVDESKEVKTFDYVLMSNDRSIAAVEIKRLGRVPRTPENGWRRDGAFMTHDDNSAARVGKAIHNARKQLRMATDPMVLVFVNDDSLDFLDLREAL